MKDDKPYNPLEKMNLGKSVAEALLAREPKKLNELESFHGAGIYAIYYHGDFPAYRKLSHINAAQGPTVPIYVGKAIPEGGRKGGSQLTDKPTKALSRRLAEHADSIQCTTLKIEDFVCRYLVVDDIWIPLGESLLIAQFSPLWNVFLDGFGNHDPGKGRYQGLAPKWDVLHPGRAWAEKCKKRPETQAQIQSETQSWLDQSPYLMQSRFEVNEAVARYQVRSSKEEHRNN
jgi:Eco29kI restriction endonuclease